jgi:FK506-binding protein 2
MPKATKTEPKAVDPVSSGIAKSNSNSSSSSSKSSTTAAHTHTTKKKKAATATATAKAAQATPKSVLDKIVYAIRQQPPSASTSTGGFVSRVAITKYLKSEFDYDNNNAIKLALKKGIISSKSKSTGTGTGILVQSGQSFRVKNDLVRQPPPEADVVDEDRLQIEDVVVVVNSSSKAKGGGGGGAAGKEKTNTETSSLKAERGDTVTVKYVGTLDDGTQFDAAKSFSFMLGAGDVIKGWDQGLLGMTIGAKRKLVVPSKLAYGKRGSSPDIPPNATLHFEITMKKIVKGDE